MMGDRMMIAMNDLPLKYLSRVPRATPDQAGEDRWKKPRARLSRLLLPGALFLVLLLAAGCGNSDEPDDHADHDHTVPVAESEAGTVLNPDGETQLWTCGMHPQIISEEPGQCPICGMDLTPVRGGTSAGVVEIDPVTIQNIGVRTAVVEERPLQRTVRTTGTFAPNERATTAVTAKIGGWVERLHIDYEGARVRQGQPLLEVYSPDLVSTQEEYLLALRNAQRLAGTMGADDAQRLVEAARRRLAYWDISAAQIQKLEEEGTPQRTLTLYAPASGTVTEKNVLQGQRIMPGEPLLRLTDLSRLWLMIDVYERDLAWVEVGTGVLIELPYQPGTPVRGTVDYLYDTLDPQTRTVKARVTVSNPDRELKPGMYATAVLTGAETAFRPAVPTEALLHTGERSVVILALGDGRFRPAEVTAGLEADGWTQILSGLEGGERVVTSAQFLIDSEARLKSAITAMGAGHDHGTMAAGDAATLPEASARDMRMDIHAADQDGDGHVYQCDTVPHLVQDAAGSIPGCPGETARVTLGAAQTALHNAGHTNVPVDVRAADENGDGTVYQCPMDWAVLHDHEGRCEVCGMNLQAFSIPQAQQNLHAAGFPLKTVTP